MKDTKSDSPKNIYRMPIAVLVIFTLLGMSFMAFTSTSGIRRGIIGNQRINILLMGISETDNAMFAEVVKLISYEPVTGFIDILSIPRDTMVPVPYEVTWKRIQKLDEIYSRYNKSSKNSLELFVRFRDKLVEYLNNYIGIDYYIQIDYNAFVDIVDKIGGVELEVLKKMDYDDSVQDLHIHISTGVHYLSGEEALKYVRYRDKIRGDIGRQERQQNFLRQIIKKMKSLAMIPRVPGLVKAIRDNVETNLSMADLLVLADELRNFRIKNYRMQMIPGEPVLKWGKSYWKVDKMKMQEVLDVIENSQLINCPLVEIDMDTRITETITAEVWNATNRSNLARELTRYLRERNVDVVRYGNYGVYKKYTKVISRNGDLVSAREVSNIIGCRNIRTELDTSRMVDINIVIGEDFRQPWEE